MSINWRLSDFIYDTKNDLLGKGKHGYVYKVLSRKDNNIYALKIVKKNENDRDQAKNIIREYNIMSNINHPYLEKSYGGFIEYYPLENQNCYFFVLEFIKGKNLTTFLEGKEKKKEYIEQKLIIKIIKEIAEGLGYLHKSNILHRDISTDNIMIEDDSYNIKITDFGISAYYKEYNMNPQNQNPMFYSQSIVGRIDIVSPEIYNAFLQNTIPNYDFKTDIYSFGISMFKLMTFYNPSCIKCRNIPNMKYANKIDSNKYDKRLIEVIMQMLNEDPTKRPTCEEIINKLDNFIDNLIDNKSIVSKLNNGIKVSKQSSFSCVIKCLSNVGQIYKFLVENQKNKKNKKLNEDLFSVIKAFIIALEKSKGMKNLNESFVNDFINEANKKIIIFKEKKNITPKMIFQKLFNYFLENLPMIFVYNNIKGAELYDTIKSEEEEQFYINEKINKFMKKYKNIFVKTFYFLVLKEYKCGECKHIIKQDIDIEYDIEFESKGSVTEILKEYLEEKECDNTEFPSLVCSKCGVMPIKLFEIKHIYTAPEVIILHFNNFVVLNDFIQIETSFENSLKTFSLNSIILGNKTINDEIIYEIALKQGQNWIYYTNNGSNVLSLSDIIKKGDVCCALYELSLNEFSVFH